MTRVRGLNQGLPPEDLPFWSLSSYHLGKEGALKWSAQLHSFKLMPLPSLTYVSIADQFGHFYEVPIFLTERIEVPPKVTRIQYQDLDLSMDYNDESMDNGLTQPFNLPSSEGALVLFIAPPVDSYSRFYLSNRMREIEIQISYFNEQNGVLTKLDMSPYFSDEFRLDRQWSIESFAKTSWNFLPKSMIFEFDDSHDEQDLFQISIPHDLLLWSQHSEISKLQLKIAFKGFGKEAASHIWINITQEA